jgi:hypothetical protein
MPDHCRQAGGIVTYVGQPWSSNCRVWVYFDALLDAEALKRRFALPECVHVHTHRGTHDGSEHGLVCEEHHDGVMGRHPDMVEATDNTVKRIA